MNDWEYEYDGINRLEAATSVFDIDFTYDSMGNKTQEVEGAVTTNYAYSNIMRPLSKIEDIHKKTKIFFLFFHLLQTLFQRNSPTPHLALKIRP